MPASKSSLQPATSRAAVQCFHRSILRIIRTNPLRSLQATACPCVLPTVPAVVDGYLTMRIARPVSRVVPAGSVMHDVMMPQACEQLTMQTNKSTNKSTSTHARKQESKQGKARQGRSAPEQLSRPTKQHASQATNQPTNQQSQQASEGLNSLNERTKNEWMFVVVVVVVVGGRRIRCRRRQHASQQTQTQEAAKNQ